MVLRYTLQVRHTHMCPFMHVYVRMSSGPIDQATRRPKHVHKQAHTYIYTHKQTQKKRTCAQRRRRWRPWCGATGAGTPRHVMAICVYVDVRVGRWIEKQARPFSQVSTASIQNTHTLVQTQNQNTTTGGPARHRGGALRRGVVGGHRDLRPGARYVRVQSVCLYVCTLSV